LAASGRLVRFADAHEQTWRRFVAGRPVSAVTLPFRDGCCPKLDALGKTALLLVGDNAPGHVRHAVRDWMGAPNREVKRAGRGVRLLPCFLPLQSPWRGTLRVPIEPTWIHGQRKIVEPARLLTARASEERVCDARCCSHEDHLSIPEKACLIMH
jgi:hypothetical protein